MISKSKEQLLYTYDGPIEWNVTGFGEEELMKNLLMILKVLNNFNCPNPFRTIHGSYICKYNGGRSSFFMADRDFIYSRIKYFNNALNMGVKLTFSNKTIHKEQFYEEEMQWYLNLLSECKGLGNGIICVNDDFAELVKKNFPDLEIVASHVKLVTETKLGITDTVDYYNSKFDLYDTVVMNTFRAFDDEFLAKIKHPEKVELIVNHHCTTNCGMASYHHDIVEEKQNLIMKYNNDPKLYEKDEKYKEICDKANALLEECHKIRYKNIPHLLIRQRLNREEINYLIKNFGITKFKIEGRDAGPMAFLNAIKNYIVNPESIADSILLKTE